MQYNKILKHDSKGKHNIFHFCHDYYNSKSVKVNLMDTSFRENTIHMVSPIKFLQSTVHTLRSTDTQYTIQYKVYSVVHRTKYSTSTQYSVLVTQYKLHVTHVHVTQYKYSLHGSCNRRHAFYSGEFPPTTGVPESDAKRHPGPLLL